MSNGFLTADDIYKKRATFFPHCDSDLEDARGASCDLRLGKEVHLSSDEYPRILTEKEPFVSIPRGQFALLMTHEYVHMPLNYLGLISFKFTIKAKGLMNISGFHIDPGRDGCIIFSVYNAGPSDVVLKYKQPIFMIFFCKLEKDAPDYKEKGHYQDTKHLPIGLVSSLKGMSASLPEVEKRVRELEVTMKIMMWLLAASAAGVVGLLIKVLSE